MLPVSHHPSVEDDVLGILRYYAAIDEDLVRRCYAAMAKTAQFIAQFPEIGSIYPSGVAKLDCFTHSLSHHRLSQPAQPTALQHVLPG